MEITVRSLVRGALANWWEKKPVEPKNLNPSEKKKHEEAKSTFEAFSYNATVNIANGSLIAAVVAAVAGIFSGLGPILALLTTTAAIAIHRDAKRSLPMCLINRNEPYFDYTNVKGEEPRQERPEFFGLDNSLFMADKKQKVIWEQTALKIFGFSLWFNNLPIDKSASKAEPVAKTVIQPEKTASASKETCAVM